MDVIENSQDLEAQFDRQEPTVFNKKPFDIVDICAGECKTKMPTYVAPGWGATPSVYKQAIISLAATGRRVIAASGFPELMKSNTHAGSDDLGFPKIEWRRAEMVIRILDAKKIPQVDAVGHSESALFLALAAYRHPARFRNLILINPVAVARHHSKKKMLWRSFREYFAMRKTHATQAHVRESFLTHMRIMMANPKMHWSASDTFFSSKLPPVLRELKTRGHGISIIHGKDDQLFPVEEVVQKVDRETVDAFYEVDGSHSDLHLDPEPLIKVIDFALDELEKKSTHLKKSL